MKALSEACRSSENDGQGGSEQERASGTAIASPVMDKQASGTAISFACDGGTLSMRIKRIF